MKMNQTNQGSMLNDQKTEVEAIPKNGKKINELLKT